MNNEESPSVRQYFCPLFFFIPLRKNKEKEKGKQSTQVNFSANNDNQNLLSYQFT